jgi:signal transduction histidine kinase
MLSMSPLTEPPRADLPKRHRPIGVSIAAAMLVVCAAGLLAVDRELDDQMAVALATQRIHIEKVTAIRRSARSAYVLILERWLRPLPERSNRERGIEQAVDAIRKGTDDFAGTAALSVSEAQARNQLITAVAMWSNRVHQAVVSADGPAATEELRTLVDDIDKASDKVLSIASSAGTSTDARVTRLHARQAATQGAFVVAAAGILGLAFVWWRGKLMAERRFRASERARAEQRQRERTRTQFFANTSHELRTPLVAIRGFAALISDTPELRPSVRDATLRIDREATDLLGQIDNILDAAKLARGEVEVQIGDVDVENVVRRCVQRCAPLVASKAIILDVDIASVLPHVRSDAVKLQHVLMNLLANAIKFTEQGRVSVRARAVDGTRILFEVEDTGIGISNDALQRIWNPFEQADSSVSRRFGGTGLGLSIVRALVDRLGGEVAVRSTLGIGTTFTVALPAIHAGVVDA